MHETHRSEERRRKRWAGAGGLARLVSTQLALESLRGRALSHGLGASWRRQPSEDKYNDPRFMFAIHAWGIIHWATPRSLAARPPKHVRDSYPKHKWHARGTQGHTLCVSMWEGGRREPRGGSQEGGHKNATHSIDSAIR
jgi:hypothetical protein